MNPISFITHPHLSVVPQEPTWKLKYNNSYDRPLLPGAGILTLKRSFAASQARRVRLWVSALGIFRLYLNGQEIHPADGSRPWFRPGWTDYNHRVFYFEYELTSLCKEENCFVAQVAPGWYASRISYGIYGWNPPAFAARIEITHDDGQSTEICTDPQWDCALCGPVLTSDHWDGEYYDATLPKPWLEWDKLPWEKAILGQHQPPLTPPLNAEVYHREDLSRRPRTAVTHQGAAPDQRELSITQKRLGTDCECGLLPKGSGLILDFAQELVGVPLLKLKAKRGTKIEVFFAELLNDSGDPDRGNDGPKGSLYLANYRSALSRIVYVASGEEEEEYLPSYCFFGFRYLELRADADVEIRSVTAQVLSSITKETASFTCSDPEVNRLYQNLLWGMRANYLNVPTDCPQRDERLGWTGDTQLFFPIASYLADTDAFMRKWLQDCRDSQIGYRGAYSNIVPRVFSKESSSAAAAWTDGCISIPHRLWQMYGNTAILAEHYQSMEDYMDYLASRTPAGPQEAFGDWLAYQETNKAYLSLCCYAQDARLMGEISRVLEKTQRAEHYESLFASLRSQWQERYLKNGALTEDTQTAHLLALAFALPEQSQIPLLCQRLRQLIAENNHRLSTGFVGTALLAPTLSQMGMDDLCYSLLFQTENPSWLYTVRQGATTMWERWNSYTLDRGFGDVSMNSFNHYAYGAVGQWFYEGICGILPAAPGFAALHLRPTPDSPSRAQRHMTHAHAVYHSRNGTIESGWSLTEQGVLYRFSIPAGMPARVSLICPHAALEINGTPFTRQELDAHPDGKGRLCFSLPAGEYEIRV